MAQNLAYIKMYHLLSTPLLLLPASRNSWGTRMNIWYGRATVIFEIHWAVHPWLMYSTSAKCLAWRRGSNRLLQSRQLLVRSSCSSSAVDQQINRPLIIEKVCSTLSVAMVPVFSNRDKAWANYSKVICSDLPVKRTSLAPLFRPSRNRKKAPRSTKKNQQVANGGTSRAALIRYIINLQLYRIT